MLKFVVEVRDIEILQKSPLGAYRWNWPTATAVLGTKVNTPVAISTAAFDMFSGIGTFTTSSPHDFYDGDRVVITGKLDLHLLLYLQ